MNKTINNLKKRICAYFGHAIGGHTCADAHCTRCGKADLTEDDFLGTTPWEEFKEEIAWRWRELVRPFLPAREPRGFCDECGKPLDDGDHSDCVPF